MSFFVYIRIYNGRKLGCTKKTHAEHRPCFPFNLFFQLITSLPFTVVKCNAAVFESLRFYQLQLKYLREAAGIEQMSSTASHDRVHDYMKFIDQARRHQFRQQADGVYRNRFAGLLFQFP